MAPIVACHFVAVLTGVASAAAGSVPTYLQDLRAGQPAEQIETVSLLVGRSTLIRFPWRPKTVSVTDPTVANVEVVTDRQVLVQGKSAGSTDIIVLDDAGQASWQARIDVDVDVRRIKDELERLFPDCTLDVRQSADLVIVTGTLARAEQAERMHKLLDTYTVKYVDMTRLAGVQQVELFVRVAEVSRVAMRTLGFNGFLAGENFRDAFAVSQIGGINPINIGAAGDVNVRGTIPFLTGTDGIPISSATTVSVGFPRVAMQLFIQALAENQYLRILAEPRLVALSGEEASFLAGGEFPIPVPQSAGGGGVTISIQYKEFGVRLRFRPTVLGDNTIRLLVAPEVSELSDTGAVEIQGFRVPALLTRRGETTLQVKSGQTFAMAGLLQQTNAGRAARVPGLGDLPVLGALFRSVRYQKSETELVVLVTATLVEPLSLAEAPPLPDATHVPPNDWELYAFGRLEGDVSGPRISPLHAVWLGELGLDRLRGPGAWVTYDTPPAENHVDLQPAPTPAAEESGQGESSSADESAGQAGAAR